MSEVPPKVFLLDVDGVMTTGHFLYSELGKILKVFGPDDNDALSLLKPYLNIRFVTGDKKGFKISHRRIVEDMGYSLDLVSTLHRLEWIKDRFCPKEVIYMGDGIFDHYVFKGVAYGIATSNSDHLAKEHADFITLRKGGDRAVAEACLHILSRFFDSYNPNNYPEHLANQKSKWTAQ